MGRHKSAGRIGRKRSGGQEPFTRTYSRVRPTGELWTCVAQGFSPASIAALKGCATTRLWWERLAFRGQRDSWSGGNPVGSKYAVQVADRLRCILVHRIDLAALVRGRQSGIAFYRTRQTGGQVQLGTDVVL